jgi:hypothetical protein
MNLRFKPSQKLIELRGAGDLVALVAEPIKLTVRRIKPDWMEDCDCERRREFLNRLLPVR